MKVSLWNGLTFNNLILEIKLPIVSAGESLEDALRQLYLIDAIDENGQITEIGKAMAGKSLIQNIHAWMRWWFICFRPSFV